MRKKCWHGHPYKHQGMVTEKLSNLLEWISREEGSERPAVLIPVSAAYLTSKQQIVAPTQIWQQYFMQGCMVDL